MNILEAVNVGAVEVQDTLSGFKRKGAAIDPTRAGSVYLLILNDPKYAEMYFQSVEEGCRHFVTERNYSGCVFVDFSEDIKSVPLGDPSTSIWAVPVVDITGLENFPAHSPDSAPIGCFIVWEPKAIQQTTKRDFLYPNLMDSSYAR